MAGRYRALLIGNSTYPADEHNLQTLKGPVKDIAALNRALVDRDTGMFADVDVTLLPETTSDRAIRALGRFFGSADRDDVLLVYFSGHGKLDQNGRLHLCMQDTDSTDLLSTAVSSTRINEFADASRARNVVIVLDCCHAGAFRGGELGDSVAGPGRYVLTSCRGTQLANDATVDNATSRFTQHLVDGLLDAAPDQDADGYISFSDLYAYVDRQLRAEGRQIPQRRVDGDGDLRLARRERQPVPAAAGPAPLPPPVNTPPVNAPPVNAPPVNAPPVNPPHPTGTPPSSTSEARPSTAGAPTPGSRTGAGEPPGATRPAPPSRRWVLLAAAIVVLAGVVTAVVVALHRPADTYAGGNTYTARAPWRLRIEDRAQGTDPGCAVTLTDTGSGAAVPMPRLVYGTVALQLHRTGTFRWETNDPGCKVIPQAGSGTATLPFTQNQAGDTDAFEAPARVAVQVKDYAGSQKCAFTLYDPTDGQALDSATATAGNDTVVLDAGGHKTVYVGRVACAVQVSAGR